MSGKVIIYDHDDHDHDDYDDHLNFTYSRTLTNPSFEVSYLSFSSNDMLAVS